MTFVARNIGWRRGVMRLAAGLLIMTLSAGWRVTSNVE